METKQFRHFRECVAEALRRVNPKQGALVLDIDDTILRFPERDCNAEKIQETYTIYNAFVHAKSRVFIVTARPWTSANERWTRDQLQCLGILHYDELVMRPPQQRDVGAYKLNARQRLARKYDVKIELTVGDQWTDLINVPRTVISRSAGHNTCELVKFTKDEEQHYSGAKMGLKLNFNDK